MNLRADTAIVLLTEAKELVYLILLYLVVFWVDFVFKIHICEVLDNTIHGLICDIFGLGYKLSFFFLIFALIFLCLIHGGLSYFCKIALYSIK